MRKLLILASLGFSALSCGSEEKQQQVFTYPAYSLKAASFSSLSPCQARIISYVEDFGPCNRFSPLRTNW